ncbi:ABC-2 type transport system permease protein [Antricoccus suffuscus]|uniref:ABC-2 type transport system permease protein n=1 Tax=Antricoccus suffuscus TaxID=1629062 RepID=A0A2T1A630_9ACTN|nr:ABC transporter permease subunit [Antricoccus suffuscus]PRZ44050.1 ABC-2 type transport system permease protein [Antricoccus suffuscus]
MAVDILRLDARLRRRSIIGYSLGMAAYVLVVVVIYPAFKDSSSLDNLVSSDSTVAALFGVTGSLTSPSGWLNANVYANFLPLILLLMTIGYGASAIAGQAEEGTLSLVTTLPLSRRRIAAQKLAVVLLLTIPVGVLTLAMALIGRWFQLEVALGPLLGATIGALLLGVDFGILALLVGAWTGSRGTALGVVSALAAASYLIGSLATTVQWMHPLRFVSLFYWSVGNNQLTDGLSATSVLVLIAVALIAAAAAVTAFDRLDVP